MKIGKHIGKRAKYKNKLGYFFETINHKVYNLFVFDTFNENKGCKY